MKYHFFFTGVTVLLILSGVALYHLNKSLPTGLAFQGPIRPASSVKLLTDRTFIDDGNVRHVEQQIFDTLFALINGAERLILLDMFLFNEFQGQSQSGVRPLSEELTDLLVAKKQASPTMTVVVITDPINTVYQGLPSAQFNRLRQAGVDVVLTRLEPLRDSNPLYSSFWRLFLRPFGNGPGRLLPNPFGMGRVSLRSYLALLNFKANHRKVCIVDHGTELVGLVTSANPHDASSAHGNVALMFNGAATHDLLATENAVLTFAGVPPITLPQALPQSLPQNDGLVTVQVLTEARIKEEILAMVNRTGPGATIDLLMFYLSHRDIIVALKKAHQRGAQLRVLLDPNKDAFGRQKNGIPNRQVAAELVKAGIPVRFTDTHGEQSHSKMLTVIEGNDHATLLLGSANFTRRNLDNLNLETDVAVRGLKHERIFADAADYFNSLWSNSPGKFYSVDYSHYADMSRIRTILYRLAEASGICTF